MRLEVDRSGSDAALRQQASFSASERLTARGPLLICEVGSALSRSALFDVVEGKERLITSARTVSTMSIASSDVLPGIRRTIAEIERSTHRRLQDGTRIVAPARNDGGGVGEAVLTVGSPLRLLAVSLPGGPDRLLLDRVLLSLGAIVVERLIVDDLTKSRGSLLERLLSYRDDSIDVLLVAGPSDTDGDHLLGQAVSCIVKAFEHRTSSPSTLFFGRPGTAIRIETALGRWGEVRVVEAGSASPTAIIRRQPALQAELRAIWRDRLAAQAANYSIAQSWMTGPIVPSADSFALALRFLAKRRGNLVLGVDIGSTTSTLIEANPDEALIDILPRGVGGSLGWAMREQTVERIANGAPTERVFDRLANRALRPWAVPLGEEESRLSGSLVGEIARLLGERSIYSPLWPEGVGLIVLRGGAMDAVAKQAGVLWSIALGLGLTGVAELAHDSRGILPGLGALAATAPLAAAEALIHDGLSHLGTVVIAAGEQPEPGEPDGTLELRYRDGKSLTARLNFTRPAQFLLASNETAELTISPGPTLDVGVGAGMPLTIRVRGGGVGIIVGARHESRNGLSHFRGSLRCLASRMNRLKQELVSPKGRTVSPNGIQSEERGAEEDELTAWAVDPAMDGDADQNLADAAYLDTLGVTTIARESRDGR